MTDNPEDLLAKYPELMSPKIKRKFPPDKFNVAIVPEGADLSGQYAEPYVAIDDHTWQVDVFTYIYEGKQGTYLFFPRDTLDR